jgi:hypothetical protein
VSELVFNHKQRAGVVPAFLLLKINIVHKRQPAAEPPMTRDLVCTTLRLGLNGMFYDAFSSTTLNRFIERVFDENITDDSGVYRICSTAGAS